MNNRKRYTAKGSMRTTVSLIVLTVVGTVLGVLILMKTAFVGIFFLVIALASFALVIHSYMYVHNEEERKISVDELVAAARDGSLEEVFGTGTAAVVSPVGKLRYKDDVMTIGGGEIGELTQKLYDEITGIQWGKRPDPFGWRMKV